MEIGCRPSVDGWSKAGAHDTSVATDIFPGHNAHRSVSQLSRSLHRTISYLWLESITRSPINSIGILRVWLIDYMWLARSAIGANVRAGCPVTLRVVCPLYMESTAKSVVYSWGRRTNPSSYHGGVNPAPNNLGWRLRTLASFNIICYFISLFMASMIIFRIIISESES